ncbi:MAG: membrane protein insertase YidC [Actinobacteria bacterium]|nr:membrane protein insertase YidC [Actinomycetota bacterium]
MIAGILTPFENVLTEVLKWLHTSIGLPWAWSIVGLTVIVRMLIVPLTVRQIHSMQRLQHYAPEMKEIQRKYKGDRQRMNEEVMKFYREHKINPASACLPMIPQLPVFFALYFVLRDFDKEVFPDYPGSSLDWLGLVDITEKASEGWGPMLLVIYAGSQLASTYFMAATMDKMQRNILMVLPIVFLFVVVSFPTGLVLYWATTNLWTVGQGLVTRRLVPRGPAAPARTPRSSRTPPKDAAGDDGAGTEAPKPPPPKAPAGPPRRVKRKKKGARR